MKLIDKIHMAKDRAAAKEKEYMPSNTKTTKKSMYARGVKHALSCVIVAVEQGDSKHLDKMMTRGIDYPTRIESNDEGTGQ